MRLNQVPKQGKWKMGDTKKLLAASENHCGKKAKCLNFQLVAYVWVLALLFASVHMPKSIILSAMLQQSMDNGDAYIIMILKIHRTWPGIM